MLPRQPRRTRRPVHAVPPPAAPAAPAAAAARTAPVPTQDTIGSNNSTPSIAEQLTNAHRRHVDEVLECLRNEMSILADFEASQQTSVASVAAYASQIAENMHTRETKLETMYQTLGTLCATLANVEE